MTALSAYEVRGTALYRKLCFCKPLEPTESMQFRPLTMVVARNQDFATTIRQVHQKYQFRERWWIAGNCE